MLNPHRVRIGILNCMNWWTNEVSLKWSAASVIRICRTTQPFLHVIEIGIIFSVLMYNCTYLMQWFRSNFKQTYDCSVAKSHAKCDTWPLDCIWHVPDDLMIIHGSLFPPLAPRSYLTAGATRRRRIAPHVFFTHNAMSSTDLGKYLSGNYSGAQVPTGPHVIILKVEG